MDPDSSLQRFQAASLCMVLKSNSGSYLCFVPMHVWGGAGEGQRHVQVESR